MSNITSTEPERIISKSSDDSERTVSLDPATFSEETPLDPVEEPMPEIVLEDVSRRACKPGLFSETKNARIKNCHPLIPEVLEYVAGSRDRTMAEVGLIAFVIGKDLMWSLPSVGRVKRARKRILKCTGNMDGRARARYRRRLDQFTFDMGTDQTVSFQIKLFESHLSEVNHLGALLGKGMVQKVRQFGLMAGLIHSRYIEAKDQHEMIEILKRFVMELDQWAEDLEKIATSLKNRKGGSRSVPVERPWDEVLQPCNPRVIDNK